MVLRIIVAAFTDLGFQHATLAPSRCRESVTELLLFLKTKQVFTFPAGC